jgi:predicted TIM-barrel fold metal-dependent hydrolase
VKIFDSHFHVIDKRFPLLANNGFTPNEFSVADYQQQTHGLGIVAGAVVSGSFQAFDQQYLIKALKQLGPAFVGVTQLPADTCDEEILALHGSGVRAVRFNLRRGGSEVITNIESFANRIFELANWHVELYIDASELGELMSLLLRLPKISIDHLGLSNEGFGDLLKLVEQGAHVKASGFGRVNFDVSRALQQIAAINPEALMFGTDLPCTRAPRPFGIDDINRIKDLFDDTQCEKIFFQNACDWYQPVSPG